MVTHPWGVDSGTDSVVASLIGILVAACGAGRRLALWASKCRVASFVMKGIVRTGGAGLRWPTVAEVSTGCPPGDAFAGSVAAFPTLVCDHACKRAKFVCCCRLSSFRRMSRPLGLGGIRWVWSVTLVVSVNGVICCGKLSPPCGVDGVFLLLGDLWSPCAFQLSPPRRGASRFLIRFAVRPSPLRGVLVLRSVVVSDVGVAIGDKESSSCGGWDTLSPLMWVWSSAPRPVGGSSSPTIGGTVLLDGGGFCCCHFMPLNRGAGTRSSFVFSRMLGVSAPPVRPVVTAGLPAQKGVPFNRGSESRTSAVGSNSSVSTDVLSFTHMEYSLRAMERDDFLDPPW